MESIMPSDLKTKEERARYALLMSAALDKNYIDVASDSLIKVAVDYYSVRNDQQRRMMAHYYQGLFLFNAQNYTAAMVALEKAEKDAIELDNNLYAGLILRTKAEIYNKTMNEPESVTSLIDAISHFKLLENPNYAAYAELGLAILYINNDDFTKAKQQLESVLTYNDDNLNDYYSLEKASIMIRLDEDPYEAINLFRASPESLFVFHDYCLFAYAMENIGQRDSTDKLFSKAYSLCVKQADSAHVDFMYAEILHRRENDAEAYRLTRKAAFVQDSVVRELMQQSVSNAQRDYYKAESRLQEERAGRLSERNRLGAATALLAIALLSGLTLSYRKRTEQEIQEQILKFSITQSELHRAEQENASLLGSLFSEKFNHLDKLSANYVRADNDRERMVALKDFKEEISEIRTNEDLFLSLEKDLDRYCDGVMTKLKDQVPSIKGDNRKLISLFFAGLPYSTVQLVMNRVSIESLKTARSRFRKEIKAADAPDEELFLRLLEMKK
jgi:tetratricopeptide (TPR) repeat protein